MARQVAPNPTNSDDTPARDDHSWLPHASLLKIRDVTKVYGWCVSRTYALLNSGKISARKDNGLTLVDRASVDKYVANLPSYEGGTQPHLVGVERGRKRKAA